MDMLQYGLVAVGLALFTIVAIAVIDMGGSRRGPRDELSRTQEHPRTED